MRPCNLRGPGRPRQLLGHARATFRECPKLPPPAAPDCRCDGTTTSPQAPSTFIPSLQMVVCPTGCPALQANAWLRTREGSLQCLAFSIGAGAELAWSCFAQEQLRFLLKNKLESEEVMELPFCSRSDLANSAGPGCLPWVSDCSSGEELGLGACVRVFKRRP